ncbi:MAG: PLP-dependent aspartate aminotransferase family protein [Clostridiales Family XIII bacterium]|nr:PLP-dependent aspartate aminotransferase family protein [Clostridiales Family XIII bacterium]
MRKHYNNLDSALIHGGVYGDITTGAVNTPIYQTSTYQQDAIGQDRGWEYSRTGNPTRYALETLIAELEGGVKGLAYASGMAAITGVLSILKSGDKVLISSNVYGGTFRVLDKVFVNFGINYEIVDTTDLVATETVIKSSHGTVKAVLIESPANPLLTITDIKALAEIAHRYEALFIVDNTFMTPYLQRPLELGADIVLHSATKYIGGHSDVIAGLVVTNNDDLAERLAFVQNSTGGVLQPFDSYLLIRSIKTLHVRMDRHVENAEKIATFLDNHDAVNVVYYPGLKSAQGYEINQSQAKNGGAMISFELADGYDAPKFFASVNLIALAESLGGVESLACHPASMTHASIPKEIRDKVGITDGLIRLSVGIESVDDLIQDIDQAIAAAATV